MTRKFLAAFTAVALLMGACSSAPNGDETTDATTAPDPVELTFRIWDIGADDAYEESFDAFTAENPHISVTIETVDENQYWDRAESDTADGTMPDAYWIDPSNVAALAEDGTIVEITADRGGWAQSLVQLFTLEDQLWGVPQMWRSVALYYNRDLYADIETNVENLTWSPDEEEDILLEVARTLTVDEDGNSAGTEDFDPNSIARYGYAVQPDLTRTFVPFLVQAGGQFQDDDGHFVFASDEGEQSTQYLTDLINEHDVSPPLEATTSHEHGAADLFIDEDIALYQGDSDALRLIAEGADFTWGVAPIVGGPNGKISVVDGIAVAGNAESEHPEETALLLAWLGSDQGQDPLASHGLAFPASITGQDTYVNYWAKEGVDVSVFIESSTDATTISSHSLDILPALEEIQPIIWDIINGELPVDQGLQEAEDTGNAALN